ncbi:hypothetical protein HRI_003837900 [Hibiscus trionum]|uniref:Uncharacterized protein n=1 Tax=Hibiscus trionum TaxID=183268 RepID=A0A9W7ISV2_HIBTR|nr:hypothetical protein HRI_003837900 [Hibiscus trionum]
MDTSETSKIKLGSPTQDVDKSLDDELQHLLQTLPKEEGRISSSGSVYLYQGFWSSARGLRSVISSTDIFKHLIMTLWSPLSQNVALLDSTP